MKKPKYKGGMDEIKEVLSGFYPLIREVYRVQAALGMIGGVFSVSMNTFTDFVKEVLQVKDGVDAALKLTDIDLLFITVNAGKRQPLNPAQALVRY